MFSLTWSPSPMEYMYFSISSLALHCRLKICTLHYTTLHYTTLHYTTLHYTTLHYTTIH